MPLFSAFAPFGHLDFSSRNTHGQSIYENLLDGEGGTFSEDWDSRQSARRYAQSMVLGEAQYQLDRAKNNRSFAKAYELLGELEADYQITPEQNSSFDTRRRIGMARARVSRGNRRDAVEAALADLLGDQFVAYETIASTGAISTWPAAPGSVGVFDRAGTKKKMFALTTAISIIGTPVVVHFSLIGNSEAPMVGEHYCVDTDSRGAPENIVLSAVTSTTITATFTRAHEPGTIATRPQPIWISNQRQDLIVVKPAAAQDPETRRQVNDLMARMLRAVSTWSIVSDSGTFILDTAGRDVLGSTQLA